MMKHFFCILLALAAGALAVCAADNTVVAAQQRLKADGFYFGEVTGQYDSATAAAVSRYQIRNGLRISGQLDAETAKALGLAAPAARPPASGASEREVAGRLRRADTQFLQQAAANRSASRSRAPEPSDAKPPPLASDGSVLVLSRERLRDYIAAFILAGLESDVDSELDFFADKVRYFNEGTVDRAKIRKDLESYNRRWPERQFRLAGEVQVEPQPDSRVRVTFPLRFELASGKKQSSGTVVKTLLLEVVGEDLQIVAVDERKAK